MFSPEQKTFLLKLLKDERKRWDNAIHSDMATYGRASSFYHQQVEKIDELLTVVGVDPPPFFEDSITFYQHLTDE